MLKPLNLLVTAYLLVIVTVCGSYLMVGMVNLVLGLIALPFCYKVNEAKKGSSRFGWMALVLSALCFLMPVKTLLYFSSAFAVLFFIETFYGKTSLLLPAAIFFLSPVFQYMGDVFSFPIRLQLTHLAALMFGLFGSGVEAKGNMIIYNGNEFSVDPACMGLSMITASLLCGIMLMGFYQKKLRRRPKDWVILLYLGIILLLNVVANLMRILVLVRFNLQPGTISHEIAGLACLFVYVLFPAIVFAKLFIRRSPVFENKSLPTSKASNRELFRHLGLLTAIIILSLRVTATDTFEKFDIPTRVDGYAVSFPSNGIVKLHRPGTLLYVKYIRGFYDTEHNPMICWTGGGYQFKNVEIEQIAGLSMFTGTITNGNELFYSAWWYDNGKNHTTKQLSWRWDLLRGADHYVLVNITCSTRQDLIGEVQNIINQKTLHPFFN